MTTEPGLRERKKLETRQRIAAAAFDMFAERGFAGVTVADIARRADVSEATVFNYFPSKEDLVYERLEQFETALIEAVRGRAAGESVTAAIRSVLLPAGGLLGAPDRESARRLATVARIIAGSPALLAREREVYDRYTRSLAVAIGGPNETESWVVANAVLGVHRALVEYVRARVLDGESGPPLHRKVRARAEAALGLLEKGLAEYPSTQG